MLKVVEESHDSTDKDSISSQGAHARPYLGHSHSISMLEYAQINVTMWGWHELIAFENLFDSPHVPSHPILFASTQFTFFVLPDVFPVWPVNSWKWTRAQKTSVKNW